MSSEGFTLSPTFDKLSGVLLSEESLDAVLTLVTEQAKETIPGVDDVSVSLYRDGVVETAAHARAFSREIDQIQYDAGEGPCLQAAASGEPVRVDSMRDEDRWPNYTPMAREKGVGSSLSLPLKVRDETLGALNCYATSEGAFGDTVEIAGVFARQASVLLSNAVAYMAKDRLTEQLKDALESREAIGKAVGILMEREGVNDDDAFSMLRTASQNSNIKLREIASQLLERTRRRSSEGVPSSSQ